MIHISMILFFILIILGLILSFLSKRAYGVFSKDKITPFRGILALFIILHHIYLYGHYPALSEFKSWGAIAVSIFLFVSGYGLNKSYLLKGTAYLSDFLKKRIFNSILLPYLIILCFQVLTLLISGEQITLPGILKNNGERWFIVAIVYLYMVFYLSAQNGGKYRLLIICLAALLYVLFTVWLELGRCWYISIWGFIAGCMYAEKESEIMRRFNDTPLLCLLVIPLLMGLVVAFYYIGTKLPSSLLISYSAIYFIIPLLFAIIIVRLNTSCLRESQILSFLSNISYEMYLSHGLVILLLGRFDTIAANGTLFIILTLILSIGYASIAKFICDKILFTRK